MKGFKNFLKMSMERGGFESETGSGEGEKTIRAYCNVVRNTRLLSLLISLHRKVNIYFN
jgi:hypothetical protein